MSSIPVFELKGAKAGPTLVILGAVHGNEPCGPAAIRLMMDDLRLTAGTVICAPVVNALALERSVRFVDANLNRILGDPDLNTHEGRLAAPLRAIIDRADFLLDLHSYSAGGPPFAFGAEDVETMAFARALPAAAIVTGWSDCYKATHPELFAAGMGTTEYARTKNIVAATFECGQHADPVAVEAGCSAIRAALIHAGLSDAAVPPGETPRHIRMNHIFLKTKPGEHARLWKHLDTVAQGEVFATYEDGSDQIAPMDGVILLPFPQARVGIEWGYLGTEVPLP